ncbi:hypothetical protein [Rubrivirga marina]|uniref:Gp5/Type VI secretion system Vgr protein OB-fold domain-containing protein n=1 Tax=Rubrivirga marina TaxID=1196024 RepID=A0A271IWW6_9BACT|nr:hypothetical protein [Rubrivirga marina]PAP75731.1 hypothetical protein BSZ37_04395 [Rubrivirga marina]
MSIAFDTSTQEARVCDVDALRVSFDDGTELPCRLLQTSAGPPLALAVGDVVLVTCPPGAGVGYVLGRVEAAAPPDGEPASDVRITMPGKVDTVRINGKRVHIQADEEVVLECGDGRIRIDKRGKVTVLGRDVTSRARHSHKIKGSSVAIN